MAWLRTLFPRSAFFQPTYAGAGEPLPQKQSLVPFVLMSTSATPLGLPGRSQPYRKSLDTACILHHSVASWATVTEYLEALKTQTFIFSQLRRPEVQTKGVSRARFPVTLGGLLPGLVLASSGGHQPLVALGS